MQLETSSQLSASNFKHLPKYAAHLIQFCLSDFISYQIQLSRELKLPLLKSFQGMSEEQLFAYSLESGRQFLSYLAQNKAEEQITHSLKMWVQNQLPLVNQQAIIAEDITLLGYIRKKAFLQFALDFVKDQDELLALIDEIDLFLMKSQTESTNTYINLLRHRIEEQSYLSEKIANTSPGIIYLLNLHDNTIHFINKTAERFFGISKEDFAALGNNALQEFIHPEDYQKTIDLLKELKTTSDKEIWSYEFRLKNVAGDYIWMCNAISIFRRDEQEYPVEIIGNISNIHEEKETREQLKRQEAQLRKSEELYKQAQALSHIGHFTIKVKTGELFITDELKRIYELEPGKDRFYYKDVMDRRHPEDKELVSERLRQTMEKNEPFDFDFRIITTSGKIKTVHAIGEVKKDEPGSGEVIVGTLQDVTERYEILEKLRKSDQQYKQAEALTHIGSYLWNLETDELEWSDEMYRIYGLEEKKNKKIISKSLAQYNHPDDQERIQDHIQLTLKNKIPFDFHYRILLRNGLVKVIHARGTLRLKNNEPAFIVGTAQDVTEKQNLIDRLRQSERMYQQAEVMANMGNYFLNLETGIAEWTDQLYIIYGLKPQSERISIERFYSFVYPADIDFVKEKVKDFFVTGQIDYSFRIVTADNKIKTIRSIGQLQYNNQGQPIHVLGTEQDITERQAFIHQLQKSKYMYQQAEVLANMGNWSMDMTTHRIEWTDQLYKIYGLEPQSEEITTERFLSFVHPADKEAIQKSIENNFAGEFLDFTFRIVTPQGIEKTLRSIAHVQRNEEGAIISIIGTEQDITERQNLIYRLQESEKLHKQAQSLASLGNWSLDLDSYKYSWSDEMYTIYEIEKGKEFTLDEWTQYIHQDDRKSVMEYFYECLKNKSSYDKHHRIVLPDGRIKMLHRKAEVVCNEQGEVLKMIGTTQDVTEQFRIQQELKENQNFIRKIADATPSIIALYNVHTGHYTFISEGIKKLLGYEAEEIKKQGVSFFISLVHPDDLPLLMQKNMEALEENNKPENYDRNEVIEFVYRMRHRDGRYVWFHTYGTIFDRDANGQVAHILNISLDVSEQHNAIKKIEEQEHFIQHIADASPTILYVFDIETASIAYINREIYFVLGYTKDEILEMGSSVTSALYHPDDLHLLPERKESERKITEADIMVQFECRLKNKEDYWQWFLVREVVFKTDEKGKVLQIVGAALDITKRKDMERKLLQNSFQLEQSNASLEEFAYVASHDLKEPLRKISTFGDRLVAVQDNGLSADSKIYLKKIIDASQRMQVMINDLLAISLISGNKSFEPFSLQQILEETLQTLEFKIEQKNAIIEADTLPVAVIIPSQFRQLFQNLLSNSLKFVKEDVQPVITIKHSYLKPDDVSQYQLPVADRYLRVDFTDNGIGFENEMAGRIFSIFQRLHGRSEYEGSGIGLAICKKILEHHGGVIFATGIPDTGATFSLILPA